MRSGVILDARKGELGAAIAPDRADRLVDTKITRPRIGLEQDRRRLDAL